MASKATQERLAKMPRAKAAAAPPAQAVLAPRDEHAEHLKMMERVVAEVAALRATLAEGFDKLVAHMLDDVVAEAAEPVKVPEPPAKDASKKSLAPKHEATLDDVRDALNAFTREHGLGEASKVVSGLGVKRLTELPPERFAEAVAALEV